MSRKISVVSFCFMALVALAAWAPKADAFSNPNGTASCVVCHPIFNGGPSSGGHTGHTDLGLPQGCNTCHVSPGDTPDTTTCGECHVAPGLPLHHDNAGAASCVTCHPGTPAPENTPVPGYVGLTVALDPCDGSEERINPSLTISLDNDGDLLYDGDDGDCGPLPEITPQSIDFGDKAINDPSSTAQEITIANMGNADLIINDLGFAVGTEFVLLTGGANPCVTIPETVPAFDNCTIQVDFFPSGVGTFIDQISFDTNDRDDLTVQLTGNGVPAAAGPQIVVSPASKDYGNVTVGNSSSQVFTVSNTGTADLVLTDGVLSDETNFSLNLSGGTNPCGDAPPPIAPGGNCTVSAAFIPQSVAAFTATITVTSNDTTNSPLDVPLTGNGVAGAIPDIAVTDSVAPDDDLQVPFGNVLENSSSDQTVTVTNDGTADLVVGTVASADALAAPFSIPAGTDNCSDVTLAPSESCTITVQFAPTALGAANDTFDIPSNDSDEDPVTVSVSGTGVANNPPAAPALVLPADEATGLDPASVTFEWNRSTDADGDTVEYNLFVCTDNTFAACPDPENTTPITASATGGKVLTFAASGLGMMFFGIAFAAGIGRKRKVALLLALALTAGMLLIACSDDDVASTPRGQVSFTATNLAAGTTYYWKVVATDGTDSTDSVTRSFTTQ